MNSYLTSSLSSLSILWENPNQLGQTAMTQDNSSQPPQDDQNESSSSQKPPKKRRSRKWIWIGIPVFLLIVAILLVILAPTILSSGPVRDMVVDKINKQYINGTLSIQEWSFDWSKGVLIKGIEIKDASDAHAISVGEIDCPVKLLGAITGNLNLGDVQITGVDINARRDEKGNINLNSLMKPQPPNNQPPGKLPNVKGTIHLNKAGITFEDDLPPQHQLLVVEELDATVDIKDINQPITDSIYVNGNLDHQAGATVKIDGTVSAIQNNQVDLTQLGGQQTVSVVAADATPSANQALDLALDSNLALGGPMWVTVPSFEISKGTIDLHQMQEKGLLELVCGKLLEQKGLRINSGKITLSGKGKLDASGYSFEQPLAVHIDPIDLTMKDDMGGAQSAHLPPMDLQASGSSNNLVAHLTMDQAANPILTADASASPTQNGLQFTLSKCEGDLPRLQAELGPVLPLLASSPAIAQIAQNVIVANSGKFTLAGSGSLTPGESSAKLDGSISNLTVTQGGAATPIQAMNVTLSTSGKFTPGKDGFQVDVPTLSVAEGSDLQISADPATPIHFVHSIVSGNSGSGAVKLQADLARLASMGAVVLPAQSAMLKQLTKGQANGSIQLQSASDGTNAASADISLANLNYGNYLSNETMHLTAGANAAADGSAVSKLAVNLDTSFAKVTVNNPGTIVFADLKDPSKLAVQTSIVADGDVQRLCRLAEAVTGQPVNAYPYSGHYHFEEAIQKDAAAQNLKLAGGGTVTQFQVLGQSNAVLFSDNQIPVKNDCVYDTSKNSVIIDKADPISVSLQQSGAATVNVVGEVDDLAGQRNLNGISIDLTYDLAKLWPIVQPLLPPSDQQQLADLVISGQHKSTFIASGSYPAGKAFNDAVTNVTASGDLTIDSIATHGVTTQNLDLPITLKGGIAQTVYADKPAGQNSPKPAKCNGGTLDIGVITLDLRGATMLLSMPDATSAKPHQLLKNIALNQTMAQSLMGNALANPLFGGDASVSQGFVDVSILKLNNLPLSALLTQQSAQNTGQAEVNYSVRQLQLNGGLLGVLGVTGNQPANITNADAQLSGGKVTEDTTLTLNKTQSVRVFGVVGLQTMTFMPMTMAIPPTLLPSQWLGNGNALNYLPDQIQIPMDGSVSKPQIRFDEVMPKLLADAAQKALFGNLTGQKPNNNNNQNQQQQQQQQQQNPLDNLLQNLTQPKKK
jgi:hypothetical protein